MFNELPFKDDLMEFSMWATYAIEEKNNERLFNHVMSSLNEDTYQKIIDFKKNHPDEIAANPLLSGLLYLYVVGFETKSLQDIEKAYEKYYELQSKYSFDDNIKMYMDAGCSVYQTSKDNSVYLSFPIYLYKSHLMEGGVDATDTRQGYLFPTQKLTKEDIERIQKECPEAVSKITKKHSESR